METAIGNGEDRRRLAQLKQSRDQGFIAKKIKAIDRMVLEGGSCRSRRLLLESLERVFEELKQACQIISDLSVEIDELSYLY